MKIQSPPGVSQKHCYRSCSTGFTVLEAVIVIGLLVLILGAGMPVAWNFYLSYQIDVERDNLVALLREARNLAVSNINESDHGLYFNSSNFVVFEGVSFATRNQAQDRIIPRSTAVQMTGPSEEVFAELSGRTASATYTLTNSYKTRTVDVNTEGTVDW